MKLARTMTLGLALFGVASLDTACAADRSDDGPVREARAPWLSPDELGATRWDAGRANAPLNPSALGPVLFSDNFSGCSIGLETFAAQSQRYKWYAHTGPNPGRGNVNYTTFAGPAGPASPFRCDGMLHMLARYSPADSTWHTGAIFSNNASHEGFSTSYGYVEFKARFNSAAKPLHPWVALWDWSRDSQNSARDYDAHAYWEIDAVETYLRDPDDDRLNASTFHYWPSKSPTSGQLITSHLNRRSDLQSFPTFDDQWHTYGIGLTNQYFIVYRDRQEVSRFPRKTQDLLTPGDVAIQVSSYFGPQGADQAVTYDIVDFQYVTVWACTTQRCEDL